MDITKIDEQVELLQTIGFTLSVEEKFRLKLAYANILGAHEEIDQLKFWGRIQGLTKSYYVLVGLRYRKSYQFPHKYFFWASSADLQFKELPELLLQHQTLSEKFNTMPFVGDANKILVNVQGQGEPQEGQNNQQGGQEKPKKNEEEEDDQIKKIPKKNFTQLHRLSYVVRSIENDVQCVPRDSYRMNPEHELRPNQHFYGLDLNGARLSQNWQHFRSPVTSTARLNIEDEMVVFGSGFLDTITTDNPQGSWSVQVDSKQKNISLRSLKWPGYFAFHRMNSNIFGSAYIGDGSKNVDLAFMI